MFRKLLPDIKRDHKDYCRIKAFATINNFTVFASPHCRGLSTHLTLHHYFTQRSTLYTSSLADLFCPRKLKSSVYEEKQHSDILMLQLVPWTSLGQLKQHGRLWLYSQCCWRFGPSAYGLSLTHKVRHPSCCRPEDENKVNHTFKKESKPQE